MKATGIVRRIDDLGRIVIPKEIRRTLHIREGEQLEIFIDKNSEIIFKKFSPIKELKAFVKEYAESLNQVTSHIICFIDRDKIIAVAGSNRKELIDKHISNSLEKLIYNRQTITASRGEINFVEIIDEDTESIYSHQHITPIICEGDVLGGVVFLSMDRKMGEIEQKMSLTASIFLSKQMEH